MITENLIRDILSQYKKHGWNLSRVLLLPETAKKLSESLDALFGDAEIVSSDVNAAWFSRPSKNNRVAWELRHLSEIPFALFESFDENDDKDFIKESLNEMETRLQDRTSKSKN
jgi:hypothetical protein